MFQRATLALAATALLFTFDAAVSHAATPNACDLLTPAMASSLAGVAETAAMQAPKLCAYMNDGTGIQTSLMVSDVTADFGPRYVKAAHDGAGKAEVLSGVGDEAFYVVQNGDTNVVIAFYHLKMINLSLKKKPDAAAKAAIIQTMKQIVGKV